MSVCLPVCVISTTPQKLVDFDKTFTNALTSDCFIPLFHVYIYVRVKHTEAFLNKIVLGKRETRFLVDMLTTLKPSLTSEFQNPAYLP